MIKKVDVACLRLHQVGRRRASELTGNKIFDLKAGGVDYSTTGGKVDDIKAKLDDYKQQIIDGKIKVPTTP